MITYEQAPDIELVDHVGNPARLSDFWRQGLTAFTFIRYFGCVFCREQVKDLRDRAGELDDVGLRIVLIAPERPDKAPEFLEQMRLSFPLLCDPRREAYRAYGLVEGTRGQLMSPRVLTRAAAATLRGTMPGMPDRRVSKQLPGTAIVDADGLLRLLHVARDASDHLTTDQLLEEARAILRTRDAAA